jgi:hypothetical protein
MSLFHIHKWELVGKTYSPPRTRFDVANVSTPAALETVERLASGCTTFVWKCSDPECDAIKQSVALGKEVADAQQMQTRENFEAGAK